MVQPTRSNTSTTTRMVWHSLHYDNDLYAADRKKNKMQKKNKIIRRWKERDRGGRNRKREIGTWLGECSLSESSNNLGFNNNSRQKLD